MRRVSPPPLLVTPLLACCLGACTGSVQPEAASSPASMGTPAPNGSPGGSSGTSPPASGEGTGGSAAPGTTTSPPAPGPALQRPMAPSLQRLTATAYMNSVRDLLGNVRLSADDLEADDRSDGFSASAAATVTTSLSAFDGYRTVASDVAHQIFGDATARAKLLGCQPASAADACVTGFLKSFGRRAFRHPLTADDLATYGKVVSEVTTAQGNIWAGLEYAVAGFLMDPQFLYIPLVGEPDAKDKTLRRLDPYEIASRLSFTLTDSTPDDELLAAAERGDLRTTDGIAAQVKRLLGAGKARRGLGKFLAEHFGYVDLAEVTKDKKSFPTYSAAVAAAMKQELDLTLGELAGSDRDFREIFDYRRTFLNKTLATFLGLPGPAGAEFDPVTLPEDGPRAGVLTSAGMLTKLSLNSRTSPTHRGIFVREQLLCQEVPPPPDGVNLDGVDAKDVQGLPLRDRLAEHRKNPACAGCHGFFDPIGLSFEAFDGVGLYRTMDAGKPIDDSADLDGQPFKGTAALGRLLKQDTRAAQCLVRELVRFTFARHKVDEMEIGLSGLTGTALARGFRLGDLVTSVVTSPAFLTVKTEP